MITAKPKPNTRLQDFVYIAGEDIEDGDLVHIKDQKLYVTSKMHMTDEALLIAKGSLDLQVKQWHEERRLERLRLWKTITEWVMRACAVVLIIASSVFLASLLSACATCESCSGWGPYADNGKIDDGEFTSNPGPAAVAWGFEDYTLKQNIENQGAAFSATNAAAINTETQAAYNAYFRKELIQSLSQSTGKPVVLIQGGVVQ